MLVIIYRKSLLLGFLIKLNLQILNVSHYTVIRGHRTFYSLLFALYLKVLTYGHNFAQGMLHSLKFYSFRFIRLKFVKVIPGINLHPAYTNSNINSMFI